jgi:hypothetical protein
MRLLGSLPIFLATTLILAGRSSAPPPLYPWFDEHITISPVDLPAGVSFQAVNRQYRGGSTAYLYVANESAVPLYFAEFTYLPGAIASPTPALPPQSPISPTIKVVSGIVYRLEPSPDGSSSMVWTEQYKGADEPSGLECHLWGPILSCADVVVLEYRSPNSFGSGGDRPVDLVVPEPENADLILFYDSLPIQVPLQISFQLNTAYPTRGPGLDLEDLLNRTVGVLLVLGIPALVIGVFLLIRKLIRKLTTPTTRS